MKAKRQVRLETMISAVGVGLILTGDIYGFAAMVREARRCDDEFYLGELAVRQYISLQIAETQLEKSNHEVGSLVVLPSEKSAKRETETQIYNVSSNLSQAKRVVDEGLRSLDRHPTILSYNRHLAERYSDFRAHLYRTLTWNCGWGLSLIAILGFMKMHRESDWAC